MTIARDTLALLCRRRLFWLNVWLSVAVVLAVASLKCDRTGWSAGFGLFLFPGSFLTKGSPWEATLFYGVVNRALSWWVTGAAPLLALFSLASVVPKSLQSGQAALLFPKSRSRAAVLLGRFAGGVAFLAVPATVCTAGLFLTVGWRLEIWPVRIFLAVPFAMLSFAVLASVTVMLGVLTRSASAALVVTLIFAVSVATLQDAAARPQEDADEGDLSGMVRHASGGITALQSLAWVLPRTQELSDGMDRVIGLHGTRRFRDLVRRFKIGNVKVGNTDVLDQVTDDSSQPVTGQKLSEAVLVTSGFTALVLMMGVTLLNRRDL
ncbi:MAG: hypothetical protein V4726_07540 [Verrucomicrobiota bacterium]